MGLRGCLRVGFWVAIAGVGILSLLPVAQLPAISASIWDKAQHALAFMGLALLGLWAQPARRPETLLVALLAYGVAIECAQAFSGWRQGEVADALADGVGLILGWAIWRAWRRQ